MYKEHISSDPDYDSVQAFAQHKVPRLFVIFAMPSPCLYFLPNLGPDQRCRGCVRAAAVILIRGELTILSPLVSFGSVCWLIGHSAPPTAPPRRSQKPNSREFSHFKDIKIWKLAPSISIFILTIIHRGDYFPVSIILDFPNHNYWPFIVELKGIRWAGVGSLSLCFPHKYS